MEMLVRDEGKTQFNFKRILKLSLTKLKVELDCKCILLGSWLYRCAIGTNVIHLQQHEHP